MKALPALAMACLLAACAPDPLGPKTTGTVRGWDFVESVGGMTLGQPYVTAGGEARLPIHCDVASPKGALICEPPLVRVEGTRISLTLETAARSSKKQTAHCPDAQLGALTPGVYNVAYRDPQGTEHPLGDITIPR